MSTALKPCYGALEGTAFKWLDLAVLGRPMLGAEKVSATSVRATSCFYPYTESMP